MENTTLIQDIITTGYNERNIEHRDENGKLLYTEHISEPITEVINTYSPLTETEITQQKISELKYWFENVYSMQVEQATRAEYLKEDFFYNDTIRNKTYTSLKDLFIEGSKVQSEIRDLRNKI